MSNSLRLFSKSNIARLGPVGLREYSIVFYV